MIITTKGGHKGKSTVSYNGFIGFQKVPKGLSVMDPYDFVLYQYERSRGTSQNEENFLNDLWHWDDLQVIQTGTFSLTGKTRYFAEALYANT